MENMDMKKYKIYLYCILYFFIDKATLIHIARSADIYINTYFL